MADLVGLGLTVVSDPQKTWTDLKGFAEKVDWEQAKAIVRLIFGYDEKLYNEGYTGYVTGKTGVTTVINLASGWQLLAMLKEFPGKFGRLADFAKKYDLSEALQRKIANLDPESIEKFIDDFDGDPDAIAFFERNAGGVDAWEVLFTHPNFRKNTIDLETVLSYIKRADRRIEDVAAELTSNSTKARKWLDDIKAGWWSAFEMRKAVTDWATVYRQKLPTPTQLKKFNKACIARWNGAANGVESIFNGRNGGILNTQSPYPTISAEKGLGIHPDLQSRLPANTQWSNTANCAECDAVNQALHAGAPWDEIQIHTIDIRPDGMMTDVIQCSECLDIFDGMRVTSQ